MNELTVLYEDRFLIAVVKPAGLLSVPGRGPDKADCVVSRAASEYGWIREVHRLDQATSGILLLARNPDIHRRMSRAFASGQVSKWYTALTASLPADPSLDGVLWEDRRITVFQRLDIENRPHQIVDRKNGKRAVTEWHLLEPSSGNQDLNRLELRPVTGRTHQLRLAMSVCAAPIPGDTLYAPVHIRDISHRLLLHAMKLRFLHPEGGESLEIRSEVPF